MPIANNPPEHLPNNRELRGDVTLSQVSMLGAHDAGTHDFNRTRLLDMQTVTQTQNLVEQARAGAQYFDLRPTRVNGEWMFYHGGFVSHGESATTQLKHLLNHAANWRDSLFIFKLHFREDEDPDAVRAFVNDITRDIKDFVIPREGKPLLGQVTIDESVNQGRNMAFLTKNYPDTAIADNNLLWNYGANTYGGWGQTHIAKKLINHLIGGIIKKNRDKKLLVSQTNFWSTPMSIKHHAAISHDTVARALTMIPEKYNPGIISGDFVGDDAAGSSSIYRQLRDRNNIPLLAASGSAAEMAARQQELASIQQDFGSLTLEDRRLDIEEAILLSEHEDIYRFYKNAEKRSLTTKVRGLCELKRVKQERERKLRRERIEKVKREVARQAERKRIRQERYGRVMDQRMRRGPYAEMATRF